MSGAVVAIMKQDLNSKNKNTQHNNNNNNTNGRRICASSVTNVIFSRAKFSGLAALTCNVCIVFIVSLAHSLRTQISLEICVCVRARAPRDICDLCAQSQTALEARAPF